MRHPFAGVIGSDQKPPSKPEVPNPSRRSLFAKVAGALAAGLVGSFGLTSRASASGQQLWRLAKKAAPANDLRRR